MVGFDKRKVDKENKSLPYRRNMTVVEEIREPITANKARLAAKGQFVIYDTCYRLLFIKN